MKGSVLIIGAHGIPPGVGQPLSECNTPAKAVFIDRYPQDRRTHHDLVQKIDPFDDLPEHGVATIEVRRRQVRDENLRSPGIVPRLRHPDSAAAIGTGMNFID